MPEVAEATRQRRNTKRLNTTNVQGEGSWVEIRQVTFGESKRIRAELKAAEGDEDAQIALTQKLLVDHVINWSWVGDDNQPLPLPKVDSSVIDLLTADEIAALSEAINGETDPKA